MDFNAYSELLEKNITKHRGDNTAIFFEGGTYTYNDLLALVNKSVNFIKSLGIKKGARVVLSLHDSIEFVALFFATVKVGGVIIPLSPNLKKEEFARIIDYCTPQRIFVSKSVSRIMGKTVQSKISVVSDDNSTQYFFDKIAKESDRAHCALTRKDDDAAIIYTSGTTGKPKGVIRTHAHLCVDNFPESVLKINEKDVCFSTAKLTHAYGLNSSLLFPFKVGAASILFRELPIPLKVLDLVKKYRPTLFFSTPEVYFALAEFAEYHKVSFNSARLCVSSAGQLSRDVFNLWQKTYHKKIIDTMGTTEFAHMFLSSRPGRIKSGSCGMAVKGFSVKVVNKDGGIVTGGTLGDLMVKGPSLARKRLSGNKLELLKPGWHKTGDTAMQDRDGYVSIFGREDDIFKINGQWVCASEIEEIINSYPDVKISVIVAEKDKNGLSKLGAFVLLNKEKNGKGHGNDVEVLKTRMRKFLLTKLPLYKCPQSIEFLKNMPVTSSGKIQRYKLRNLFTQIKRGVVQPMETVPFHTKAPITRLLMSAKDVFPQSSTHIAVHVIKNLPKDIPDYGIAHVHDCDEYNILLSENGELVYDIQYDDEIYRISSPATVYIPKGIEHNAKVVSGTGFFICIIMKAKYESRGGSKSFDKKWIKK
jgi:benzoate-CoA ligase family protein